MFSFFKKTPPGAPAAATPEQAVDPVAIPVADPGLEASGDLALPAIVNDSVLPAAPAPLEAAPPPVESSAPSVWRVGAAQRHPDSVAQPLPQFNAPAPVPEVPAPAPVPTVAAAESAALVPATTDSGEKKRSWLARLKAGLAKTSANLSLLFVGAKIDDDLYEELEAALLMSDAGIDATQFLLDGLKKKVKDEKLTDAAQVKAALKSLMIELLLPLQKPFELGRHQPLTMMITGVNGAGKTTTIGKLAKHMQAHQQSVLLAAGDTFRAAAREQLAIWGQRNGVTVIAQESGDPAAVAFDAVSAGRARKMDVVMVDTAGRLPTQLHLMEELKKIKRVIGKAMDGAPHEVLLVIDGNTGQNALAQVKAFDDALQLSGLVITKLDGTAKGGIIAAIARVRPIPVYFIGVGEKIEDLQAFSASEFVDALLA